MKKRDDDTKKTGGGRVTTETLQKHAESLVRVLFALQKKGHKDLKSDMLWSLIKKHWSVEKLEACLTKPKNFEELFAMSQDISPRLKLDGFVEIGGEKWGMRKAIERALKLSATVVKRRVIGLATKRGIDPYNRECTIYRLSDVEARCARSLDPSLLIANKEGFLETRGERWGLRSAIAREFGLNRKKVHDRLESCPFIAALDETRRVSKLYSVSSAQKICADLLIEKPSEDLHNGLVVSPSGEKWGVIPILARRFQVSEPILRKLLSKGSVRFRKFRNSSKKYYSYAETKNLCAGIVDETRRASKDGTFTDKEGRVWAPIPLVRSLLGISRKAIVGVVKSAQLQPITCRPRVGGPCPFFPLEKIREATKKIIEIPLLSSQIDSFQEEGETWMTIRVLSRELSLSKAVIFSRVKARGCVFKIKRSFRARQPRRFYSLGEARRVCSDLLITDALRVATRGPLRGFLIEGGKKWATIAFIAKQLGVNHIPLKDRLIRGECPFQKGKDFTGKPAALYLFSRAKELAADLLSKLIRVPKEGILRAKGRVWAHQRALERLLGMSRGAVIPRLKKRNCSTLQARETMGRPCLLYDVEEAKRLCSDLAQIQLRAKEPIDLLVLSANANDLAKAVISLSKALPAFTSDALFQALKKHWSKTQLEKALEEFKKRKKLTAFISLMREMT